MHGKLVIRGEGFSTLSEAFKIVYVFVTVNQKTLVMISKKTLIKHACKEVVGIPRQ